MLRKTCVSFCLSLSAWISAGAAQVSGPQPDPLADFDPLVTQAMTQSHIPGLSIAIVRDGQVIYAKGFGYRDVEKKLPVTTDTLFAIGSITKSFTSLIFGTLNDEGKADWDKPVRTYLPTFQLDDPIAAEHATPRDLFSHRTGLPGHDLVWYSSNFNREELFSRLKYLKSNKEFRSGYEYCNLMIMTMGYLEGRVMNSTWEELVRTRIFQPLEMSESNLSVADSQRAPDFSEPYSLKNDVVTKVPFKNIDSIGPAGSINSNARDMSRYLVFQLGEGSYQGKRIVSQRNLQLVHTGQTAIPQLPEFFTQNGLGPMVYGMGWVETTFRGHHMVWHNGGIDGFHSLLTLLPDDKTGIVILSNLSDNTALEPIAYSAFDRLLELPLTPWLDRYEALRKKARKAEEENQSNPPPPSQTESPSSHPVADYAGIYVNPGYGAVRIEQDHGQLTLGLNQLTPEKFNHLKYDIYEVPGKSDSAAAGLKGQFYMNWSGEIDRLVMPLDPTLPEEIVFKRAPETVPRSALLSLVGSYLLGQATVQVDLAGDSLRLTVPGQPTYELEPGRGLTFGLKGLKGFAVEFRKDVSGRIAEMIVTQPEGTTVARRK